MDAFLFRIWLEGIEEYEPYRAGIQQRAEFRDFPFRGWFPEGQREYVPLDTAIKDESYKDIEEVLGEFKGGTRFPASPNGYQIVDFKKGFAKPKTNPTHNVYKIGKILQVMQKEDLDEINGKLSSGEISQGKYQYRIKLNNDYWKGVFSSFQNSPSRVKGSQFYIAFSSDPHDIASMSTGRSWTSCMSLSGHGTHSTDMYCEVEKGGFVAYLIRPDDKDIKRPLARIRIRRFDNKKGQSVALPEESIYGMESPEFLEGVKKWIDEKQGRIRPGRYRMQGGEYSDTFQRKELIGPRDKKTIISWIRKWFKLSEADQNKHYDRFISAVNGILNLQEKFPKSLLEKIIDHFLNLPQSKWGYRSELLPKFAKKYPSLINKEFFDKMIPLVDYTQLRELLEKFPHFVDEETYKSAGSHYARGYIKQTGKVDELAKQIARQAAEKITIDNPEWDVDKRKESDSGHYKISNDIGETLEDIEALKPVPEPLIRRIVDFANNIDSLNLGDDVLHKGEVQKTRNRILQQIMYLFERTGSDTPTVVRFYKSLLPKWKEMGGIYPFGHAISKLGINGRDFLPFLKKEMAKLDDVKQVKTRGSDLEVRINPYRCEYKGKEIHCNKNDVERTKEAYRSVIDSIENGTGRSDKYHFDFGYHMDARLPD